MTYVRTLEGFAPPPRYDVADDPFTKAIIQESAARDGEYTTIETFELEPVDADPASPTIRDFTTELATIDPGWYRIVWEDASGSTSIGTPHYSRSLPIWAPSVAEVAALIRARTKMAGDIEVGTFNEDTRPTGREVERLIAQASRRVSTAVGTEPCSDELRADAGAATAVYTAMLIEQSYWPEQTTASGSSFKSLEALWKAQIDTLTEAVGEQCGGGESGEGGAAGAPIARGGFDDLPLIGRSTPGYW